jgi:FkbM family methyltransferase
MYRAVTGVRRRRYRFLAEMLMRVINRMPDRVRLVIKSSSVIVKKMDYQRHDIYLHIDSQVEAEVRLFSCQKEPETIEWIETFFKEGDTFFDIGANVGAYSLVASKFCHGNIKVYSFEPAFITFPQLCKNIIHNGCQDSIFPMQVALANETAIEVFNYANLIPGAAVHALGEAIDYKGESFAPVLKQSVLAFGIDDFIKQFHLPVPTHIKLDVDGIEFGILRGANETLENPLVNSVLVELENESTEATQIIEFLALKGLKIHSKHKSYLADDTGPMSKLYNYIFRRPANGRGQSSL